MRQVVGLACWVLLFACLFLCEIRECASAGVVAVVEMWWTALIEHLVN